MFGDALVVEASKFILGTTSQEAPTNACRLVLTSVTVRISVTDPSLWDTTEKSDHKTYVNERAIKPSVVNFINIVRSSFTSKEHKLKI
jgi:hypothetical protein